MDLSHGRDDLIDVGVDRLDFFSEAAIQNLLLIFLSTASLKPIIRFVYHKLIDVLPPRARVILEYLLVHRRWPNLKNPQTLNEKITWRKLYDRDPRMPDLVDKVKAKEIVARRFGKDLVIPTLRVYDTAEELDFNVPPLSQPPYVLKTNHGSTFNIFIKDRSFDPKVIREKLAAFLKVNYGHLKEEWAYTQVPRKILVEPYIETPEGDTIPDYKFHVFAGVVYAIQLVIDRFKSYRINFYDRDWNLLDIRVYGKRPRSDGAIPPPARLSDMIRLAEALGKDFPYVRVDLYEINREIKFGEMTFYTTSGFDRFDPPEWDYKFGQQWKQDWNAPEVRHS
jgi:hypothetical protein